MGSPRPRDPSSNPTSYAPFAQPGFSHLQKGHSGACLTGAVTVTTQSHGGDLSARLPVKAPHTPADMVFLLLPRCPQPTRPSISSPLCVSWKSPDLFDFIFTKALELLSLSRGLRVGGRRCGRFPAKQAGKASPGRAGGRARPSPRWARGQASARGGPGPL